MKKTINIGIVAHVDAGKTTITENLLYCSGAIKSVGRVDLGNTQTDSMELERKRGITIKSSTVSFTWNDVKVNIVDTPGHVDFISEVERSLSILDGAIIVISGVEGIQSQTRILFNTLKQLNIPTIIFINKLDRVGANSNKVLEEIKKNMSNKVVKLQEAYNEGSKDVYIKNLFDACMTNDNVIDILSDLFKAQTVLLEPLHEFELRIPQNVLSRAIWDLETMRATFDNPVVIEDEFSIKGLIPVENSKEYKMKIASYTQGKGMFITKIYGYKEVPADFKKARQKTTYDPLNKKEYLLHKLNTIRD